MRTAIFAAVLVAALRAESTSEHSSEVAHIAFDWGGTRGFICCYVGRRVWILCCHKGEKMMGITSATSIDEGLSAKDRREERWVIAPRPVLYLGVQTYAMYFRLFLA